MDTGISYCSPDWAYISSDEERWKNKIRKMADERPDEVIIIKEPESNNGYIYAKIPPKWVLIKPPVKMDLTDEERAKRAERLRKFTGKR